MKVVLKGILGREYGEHHTFYGCDTPVEVVRALEANFPGFRLRILELRQWGYRITNSDHRNGLDNWQLNESVAQAELVIKPVVLGAGGNTFKVILGVALIAAAFVIPFAAAGGGLKLGMMGVSLVISGIAGWLAPQTKPRDSDEDRSKSIGGSSVLARKSDAIPLLIGYHRVSAMPVLSSSMRTEDI